jgi:membrane-associated phospholipid phosphatase
VTAFAAAGRRYLPRGWADLARQVAIWFGFLLAYQLARGFADRSPAKAFDDGLKVIQLEQRVSSTLWELTFQRLVHSSALLEIATSWTYWLSEFAVLGLGLLWVYLRRHEHFARLRNAVLLANVIGLVGYVLAPTAPPRMFTAFGFVDTLSSFGGLNHGSGLVELASNPYAAMPSLHAADALLIGVALSVLTNRWWTKAIWAVWPGWVWFSVMATANHFWLDVVAGIGVAVLVGAFLYHRPLRHSLARVRA